MHTPELTQFRLKFGWFGWGFHSRLFEHKVGDPDWYGGVYCWLRVGIVQFSWHWKNHRCGRE